MSKLNQILYKWPPNTLVTTKWLEKKGVSRQLAESYRKSGWFEKFGPGAYKKPNEEVTWAGALHTLQKVSELPVHAGGKTALEQQGFGHYIRKGTHPKVVLWKDPDARLPAWFQKHEWEGSIQVRSASLFNEKSKVFTTKDVEGVALLLSSPEQAIMEYLHDIPEYESFDEANYIMEGLTSLRPAVLQSLLEGCRSVKVKRLFLFFAEWYSHPWFKSLDETKVNLGSGKREIIKGGRLDKKYQIVVPEIRREEI